MIINKLKINSYGKLKDKEIELNNNINIIYGKNESGKSTILKFIINSFYGASKNKNGKDISDYEKYKPWNNEDFSGKIEYKLDNGEKFEIYREFGKKNPKVFNSDLEDISKQFNIDKTKGSEFFFEQTNVDENTFMSTAIIAQQEVKVEKNIQNNLIQKISNLVDSGEDNISYKRVIDKLNKKQLDEIGTDRSKERPINILENEIKKLENEKLNLQESKTRFTEIENQKEMLDQNLKEEEIKNNLIKEIKILKENEKLENEKIKIKEKINNENLEKINKLNFEKNNLIKDNNINLEKNKIIFEEKYFNKNNEIIKKEKNKLNKKLIISLIIFFIINILIFSIAQKSIFYIIFSLTATMEMIYFILLKIMLNKKIKIEQKIEISNKNKLDSKLNEIKNIINNLENEINLLEKNKNNLNEEINKIKNENNLKNNLEKEKIKNNYSEKINLNEINLLLNSQNINYELELLQNKIYELKIKGNRIEIEKENLEKEVNKLANIEEQLVNAYSNYENLKNKNESIEIAKDVLGIAYEKMKQNISPKFTNTLSNAVKNITDGKYFNVRYSDEQGLLVELANGDYVNAERLSVGTIEQLYLSLRFAILEEVSKENIPIILDEVFAYYDDERLKNVINYINNLYKDKQVIIFTCTNREKEILNSLNIKFNLIEI